MVPTTLVALIDSGVDLSSTADAPYYNFTNAYDAYDKLAVTPSTHAIVQDTSLQHGHGSTVADYIIQGITAAAAVPGSGSPSVQIMPIRDTAPGQLSPDPGAIIRGVYWAADHGASVINMSLRQYNQDFYDTDPTDPYYGTSLSQAIQYAQSKNAMVVTAAGNESVNVDGSNPYGYYIMPGDASLPADNGLGVSLDNILVTAAVGPTNQLTSYSNWGPITVNVGAPTGSGSNAVTSYSTGYASGLAGVISALTPSASAAGRIGLIEATVTPASQSVGAWSTSGGVVNPASAVAASLDLVNLAGSYNVVGITADSATSAGNIDGTGHSFSSGQLGPTVAASGSIFGLGQAGSADAVAASGQTISLPSGSFGGLRLLGAAVNGNQSGTFTVTYTDGTTASFAQTLDDWHSSPSTPGESVAASTTYRNASNGPDPYFTGFNLFSFALPLNPSKAVRSVTLPSDRNIVIFAADVTAATPTAAASNGGTGVSLSGAYNAVGITADSAPGSGNIDGSGHSFSSSMLGGSATAGGYSFTLGPAGSADAVRAAGQTIALPSGSYGSLRLLAVGVNGTQTGTFTVNYTDGTSATFTQALDDWHSSGGVAGETVAAAMSYRNASNGRDTTVGGFNLFAYAFSLNPSKSVKSLTLPSNANIAVFAADLTPSQGVSVGLSGAYNVVGITSDSNPGPGNLDGMGASYSSGLVGSTVSAGGTTFNLGPAGSADAVAARGQTIALPSGSYHGINLLATGVNGSQSGSFTITYTDGTRVAVSQTFSDWHAGPGAPGEAAALTMSYRNRPIGRDNQAFYLYDYTLPLDPTRTVASITLPSNGNIALFALNLAP